MIRIPDTGRFELRLADGSVNPYLLRAALLVSGPDRIRNKRDRDGISAKLFISG